MSLRAFGLKFWLRPYARQFLKDLKRPKRVQDRVLSQLTSQLSGTKYGLLFNVKGGDNYEQYCKKVPIVTYDKLKHWIDRQRTHESNILVNEPVVRYAFSGDKQSFPYTRSLERSFYRLFAIKAANTALNSKNIEPILAHYKSRWTQQPTPFPHSLLHDQPLHVEGPLMVKLQQSDAMLPLLSEVFYEFMSADKSVLRVHEIEAGKIYDLIISQKSGLYRYHIGIRVLASEPFRNTPSFQVIHDSNSDFRQALS
ncbi:MAG: GH3 auxin-responsive promoter family protein [Myxococcota bacterium]